MSIFANPVAGQYASVGASAGGMARDLDKPLGPISSSGANHPDISYNSQGYYEIKLPSRTWEQLVLYGQGTPDTVLKAAASRSQIATSGSKSSGYLYSEVASWDSGWGGFGAFAFGTLTPAGAVPTSGSATYKGVVIGTSDVINSDDWFDGPYRVSVNGTVTLDFDFGKSTLSGSMSLSSFGSFAFKNTVLSAASNSYSGQFVTNATGDNFFLGQFTGPHGEETIGAWAVPFIYSGDNQTHEAFGAWIAKQ